MPQKPNSERVKMKERRPRREFDFDSLIGDPSQNTRILFNEAIRVVREERDNSRAGKHDSKNPYNPLACALSPESWYQPGVTPEYYDQRIEVYNHLLNIVDKVKGNFGSSKMVEFQKRIQEYIVDCKRQKEELRKAREHSAFVRSALDDVTSYQKRQLREMGQAVLGIARCVFESHERMLRRV